MFAGGGGLGAARVACGDARLDLFLYEHLDGVEQLESLAKRRDRKWRRLELFVACEVVKQHQPSPVHAVLAECVGQRQLRSASPQQRVVRKRLQEERDLGG